VTDGSVPPLTVPPLTVSSLTLDAEKIGRPISNSSSSPSRPDIRSISMTKRLLPKSTRSSEELFSSVCAVANCSSSAGKYVEQSYAHSVSSANLSRLLVRLSVTVRLEV
jgi:hypothetical protein